MNKIIKDDSKRRCAGISKAKKTFSFSSEVKLEKGLDRVVTWIKKV